MLREFPKAPLTAFVVWEPILITDSAGPRANALSLVRDQRAAQFWDHSHQVSASMGGPASFGPRSGAKIHFDMKKYVWDFVAVYAPGFRWSESRASPVFAGAPAVDVTADLAGCHQGGIDHPR